MFRKEKSILNNTICITNRQLCNEELLVRIDKIAGLGVKAIILREKDMHEADYEMLARQALEICKKNNTLCILHSFVAVAKKLEHKAIHLPMPLFRSISKEDREQFEILGVSCHSVEEAIEAKKLGCTYITAGHVFHTDCKKGLTPRGLKLITNISEIIDIPVYGLGGITMDNAQIVINAGAKGVCIMSGFMK